MSVTLNNARKGLLAVAVGVACAFPVAAQNTTGPTTTTTTPSTTSTRSDTAVRTSDDHRDWGWLGLLGLAGLLGLRRRDQEPSSIDRTRTASAR